MEGQKQENLQNNIENEGLNTHQYCFANISATKAPIFMKFETQLHKIGNNDKHHFCRDPSTHTHTQGINVRAHVSSRVRTFRCASTRFVARAHVYASFVGLCAWIFTKNLLGFAYYLMKISFKFHRDRSFGCGDFRKTILTCVYSYIFNVFCKLSGLCSSKAFKYG